MTDLASNRTIQILTAAERGEYGILSVTWYVSVTTLVMLQRGRPIKLRRTIRYWPRTFRRAQQ
jgi:hypothetical protein